MAERLISGARSGDVCPGDCQHGGNALLVVLHGGMGNTDGGGKSLQMDGMADKYGFDCVSQRQYHAM